MTPQAARQKPPRGTEKASFDWQDPLLLEDEFSDLQPLHHHHDDTLSCFCRPAVAGRTVPHRERFDRGLHRE